jgi:hypothetical protein
MAELATFADTVPDGLATANTPELPVAKDN